MMYKAIKRCFDFICALLALVVLSPVFVLTAVGILVSDWGPIFYKANRIGKENKPFKMYKFRSMKVLKAPKKGAEAGLRPDEARIFPFGHFTNYKSTLDFAVVIDLLVILPSSILSSYKSCTRDLGNMPLSIIMANYCIVKHIQNNKNPLFAFKEADSSVFLI